MRGMTFLWMFLGLSVAVSLFLLKYEVQALEDQLTATQNTIKDDRRAVHILKAEWAYLNDPARLRRLAEQHLGMQPLSPAHVVTADALPLRPLQASESPDMAQKGGSAPDADGNAALSTAPSAPENKKQELKAPDNKAPNNKAGEVVINPILPQPKPFRLPNMHITIPVHEQTAAIRGIGEAQ